MIIRLRAGYHCGHNCEYGKRGKCPVFGFKPSPMVNAVRVNTDHADHIKRTVLCDKYLAACCAAVEEQENRSARLPKHRQLSA